MPRSPADPRRPRDGGHAPAPDGRAQPGAPAVSPEARTLLDALPGMAFQADAAGRRVWVSAAWERYTGLAREQLMGDGWHQVVHADDLATNGRHRLRALAQGEDYCVRSRLRRHDGAWRWHLVRLAPMHDAGGAVTAWAGSAMDMDDVMRAEADAAGRESQARFLLALEERLRELPDPQAAMDAASAALGVHLAVAQVGYGEIDAAQARITVHHDWNDGRIVSVTGDWRMDDFGPAFVADIRAGRTVAIADVTQDPRTAAPAVAASYAGIRTRSLLDVPLVKDGRLVALLFIHHPEPREWSALERALVERTAQRLWGAVERARAERALAEREAFLEAVLDALPVGVVLADAQGRITRDNAAHRALWGMGEPDAQGWEQYGEWVGWRAADGQRLQAHEWAMARALRHGEVVRNEEVEIQPFDGSPRRVYLNNAAPVRDAAGRIVGGVVVELDTSAQREAAQRLQASEARLQAIFEAVPVGLMVAEAPSGRIVQANQRVEEILGHPVRYSADVAAYAEYAAFHPDGRPVQPQEHALARALAGEERPELELLYRRGDGRMAWVRSIGAPIRDAQGRLLGALIAAVDIDQQRRAALALAESVRTKDALLYEVNHRVKNNLQIVNSLLSLQLRSVRDEDARRAIEEARQRVGVMARLHMELYQGGRHGTLDFGRWVQRLAQDTLGVSGQSRHVTLDCQAPPDLALTLDLAVPLSLVLAELLTNAVKYAFPGGRRGTIALRLQRVTPEDASAPNRGPRLRVELCDDGAGLPTDFDPEAGGGLGMRIIQALLRQIGARLQPLPQAAGTGWRIELPLATDSGN